MRGVGCAIVFLWGSVLAIYATYLALTYASAHIVVVTIFAVGFGMALIVEDNHRD